jgi:tetratricopeptide (TPR) repeat protein
MKIRTRFAVALAALAAVFALLLPVSAWALGQGRIYGKVLDEKGAPLGGVKITVTCDAVSGFKMEATTNDKGDYAFSLVDATKTYKYHLEKEGYQPWEEQVKVPIETNMKKEFRLTSVGALQAEARAKAEAEMTPQEKAVQAYNAGAEAYNQQNLAAAKAKFQEAVGLDPTLATAWSVLSQLLLAEKNYKEAAAAAESALAIDATDDRALRVRLDAYKGLGDKEKVKEATAALATADPKVAAIAFINEGVTLYNAGKMNDAKAPLEKALELDPTASRAHYLLGICYSVDDKAKAREHFTKFLEMAPDDPDAAAAKEMLQYVK